MVEAALREPTGVRTRDRSGLRSLGAASDPRRVGRAYSRFVRSLKLALPIAAALLVTLLIAWPQLEWQAPPPAPIQVKPEDAESLSMFDARYVGSDEHNRPFTITADSARQLASPDQRVQLSHPQADMTLQSGAWVALSADQGLFDRDTELLELQGAVTIHHDQGYRLTTESARVDVKRGVAESDAPVAGQGPIGELTGEGFRVSNEGRTLLLIGKSSLLLRPDEMKRTQQ